MLPILIGIHVVKEYSADELAVETWCGQVFVLSAGEVLISTRWADYDPESPHTTNPDGQSLPMCADCLPYLDQDGHVPLGVEIRGERQPT